MLGEFKAFLNRGNVVDLAVGVVIGGAFGKIVTSFVNDILMPPIGLLIGGIDFSNLFFNLSGKPYASLSAAQAAGASTLNYGVFANTVIQFVIVAFAVFLLVKQVNRLNPPPQVVPATKPCPQCFSEINIHATRCPQCTSEIASADKAYATA